MIAEVPTPLVRELRAKMRDYPEINYLYSGKETQDNEYARLIFEALEKTASMPPVFTEAWNFRAGVPQGLITYILDLGMALCLREICIWMMRNDFQWQAGNTTVRLFDRWRAYSSLYPSLMQEALGNIKAWKGAYNLGRAWGASMTEMYSTSHLLDPRDWVAVTV
jgi:hypothetical protein